MSDNKDDDLLELGYEPGKRVEFVYDEELPADAKKDVKAAASDEQSAAGDDQPDTDGAYTEKLPRHFLPRFWSVALVVAVLAVVLAYIIGRGHKLSETEETFENEEQQEALKGALLPLDQQYQVYQDQLKAALLNQYPGASFLEYSKNVRIQPGTDQIILMDLDGDGVAPEAIYLTEYVHADQEDTFDTATLCVSYIDTAGQVQTYERGYGTSRATVELLLQVDQGDGARVILYQEGDTAPTQYSRIFRYDRGSTWGLKPLGGIEGRICDQVLSYMEDVTPVFERDGIYQVRQTCTYEVEEQSGTCYKVFSYDENLYNVSWNGEAIAQTDGVGAYYTMELAPWWSMRRVLLGLTPQSGMDPEDETAYQSYMERAQETMLHGSQVHIIGGFEGTDMYLVETDYGEQGFVLLTDPFEPEACAVMLQGLPFYEVFAAVDESENGEVPGEVSDELYQELDLHITQPGIYDVGDYTYVWADLNGDGQERRFFLEDLMGSAETDLCLGDQKGIYDVTIRFAATDLDPADRRMELGIRVDWTLKDGAVATEENSDAKTGTYLYYSLDDAHLIGVEEE